ncbi:hypothetical protein [Streptomyces sp. NPDC047065]|uniref:hypothetical protein n=1 Tax=Streptomyces sp. NPDC047065 TaxID=3154606 RepID=UPI0034053083
MNTVGRYHLVLPAGGRETLYGWWASETVARGKLAAWSVGTATDQGPASPSPTTRTARR